MEITYHGHSTFKIKGSQGVVVTDPYDPYVGFKLSNLSADLVTVSHQHKDHNAYQQIKGTSRRDKPFLIEKPGEYEVGGISVFGVKTYHDATKGAERGDSTIFTIMVDGIRVCHLGDLGHELTQETISEIGAVDIVLCPVGGIYTINATTAVKTIHALEPSLVIAMHFKTEEHEQSVFGEMGTLPEFMKEYGSEVQPEAKLKIEAGRLPEQTELVVLEKI
jgi:L-ascorbate metabolism protein UlaG (beta-lactamase superfamily)